MADISTPLGVVIPGLEGAYSAARQYAPLAIVRYGTGSYIAKQTTQGNAPGDEAYWQKLTDAPAIAVGTVTTGAPGTPVQVVNAGTATEAILNFTIPAGTDGAQGVDGVAATLEIPQAHTLEPGLPVSIVELPGSTPRHRLYSVSIPKGASGNNFAIKASYATYAELVAAHPTGQAGDAYLVGPVGANTVYGWNADTAQWEDFGPIQGPPGTSAYAHIKYALAQPAQDSDMQTTPGPWMGIYAGDQENAPTEYTAYAWYEIKGPKGDTGETGATGATGGDGPAGPAGAGVPAAGPIGGYLVKTGTGQTDTAFVPLGTAMAVGNPAVLGSLAAGTAVSASVDLVATQAGTGDVSPDNVRGIAGYAEAGVTREEDAESWTLTFSTALYGLTGAADAWDLTGGQVTRRTRALALSGAEAGWTMVDTTTPENKRFRLDLPAGEHAAPVAGGGAIPNLLCSHYPPMSRNPGTYTSQLGVSVEGDGSRLYFYDPARNTDLDAWKAYLAAQSAAGTPVTVLYPRDAAATEAVTPVTIQALSGQNTLGTDGTTITATGRQLDATAVGAVPDTATVNGKPLTSSPTLTAADVGAVQSAATVNGKPLASSPTLAATDVGAVPDTVTVNGKPLASSPTLTAADVGAVPLVSGKAEPGSISAATVEVTESRALTLSDAGKYLLCDSESDIILTIPADVFPLNAELEIRRWGAGGVSIVEDVGVTVNSAGMSLTEHGSAALKQPRLNAWAIDGGVTE